MYPSNSRRAIAAPWSTAPHCPMVGRRAWPPSTSPSVRSSPDSGFRSQCTPSPAGPVPRSGRTRGRVGPHHRLEVLAPSTSKPRADASIVVVLRSTMWKWKPKKHKSISASVPSTRSAIHVTRNCVGVHRRSGERGPPSFEFQEGGHEGGEHPQRREQRVEEEEHEELAVVKPTVLTTHGRSGPCGDRRCGRRGQRVARAGGRAGGRALASVSSGPFHHHPPFEA